MPESDLLLTFAELGIGLAGFSGVVVAFGDRGSLPEVDNFRFLSAFSIAICVIVLAVAPVALSYFTSDRGLIWRMASTIAVAYFAIGTPLFRRYAISIQSEFVKSEVSGDDRFVFWAGVSFALVSLVNVVGWPIAPNFGSYTLALLIAFLISAYTFATIVIRRPGGGRGA
jgi:hypothetical protein